MSFSIRKYISHQVPFIFTSFYSPFHAALRLICLLWVPSRHLSQKTLVFSFFLFFNLFSSVLLGKKGEGVGWWSIFLMSDSLGAYLISLSTCHTCLLLWLSPFERVGAEQPDIGEALAEFRFNNLAHFFHLCVFLDLGGTFLFLFTPTPWCFLCEKKETSSGP